MTEEPDISLVAYRIYLEDLSKRGGVEALVALGTLHERQRRSDVAINNNITEGLARDRDRWREEAERVRAQLDAIRHRFEEILYLPPGEYPND